jgi:VIT1/CCC1 family predicted Fe2+/Mn2+ transporter
VRQQRQRPSERALIARERRELREMPEEELDELTGMLRVRGLSDPTARQVAVELTDRDPHAAHLSLELNIVEENIANPWHAALASAVALPIGAIPPMRAILLPPADTRIPMTFAAVLLALALTGALGAWHGGSSVLPAHDPGRRRRSTRPGGHLRDRFAARLDYRVAPTEKSA